MLLLLSLLQQLVSGIQYNDMLRPLKMLSTELIKRKTKSGTVVKHHGIYRELLFLTFVAIDRENIDQGISFKSIPILCLNISDLIIQILAQLF